MSFAIFRLLQHCKIVTSNRYSKTIEFLGKTKKFLFICILIVYLCVYLFFEYEVDYFLRNLEKIKFTFLIIELKMIVDK